MLLVSYLKSIFVTLLQPFYFNKKKGTILFLGLDNAGKTTFLHHLRASLTNTTATTASAFAPTEIPNFHHFLAEGVTFKGWDLGGNEAVRHLWTEHTSDVDGIIFLVDASVSEGGDMRLDEVRDELDNLICGDGNGGLKKVPLAIMLNKCDLDTVKDEIIKERIGYDEVEECHGEDHVRLFRMTVKKDHGYHEAFRWIAEFL